MKAQRETMTQISNFSFCLKNEDVCDFVDCANVTAIRIKLFKMLAHEFEQLRRRVTSVVFKGQLKGFLSSIEMQALISQVKIISEAFQAHHYLLRVNVFRKIRAPRVLQI